MINLVLCGGSGTRLWPISRSMYPKQFIKMFEGKSLFQQTIERNAHICDKNLIVSNEDLYFIAYEQLPNKKNTEFLLEPVGRNTAPAIALSCFALAKDEVILVSPSDHSITTIKEYTAAVELAKAEAEKGYLVTFGIKPAYPETGYGYIETDAVFDEQKAVDVISFKEKPAAETAQKYIDSGKFYWNSGMFCFTAGTFLEELKKYSPEIYEASEKAYKAKLSADFDGTHLMRVTYDAMMAIPENSIDYAVMEKSTKVKVVLSEFVWNDLGSFDSLYDISQKDENGNAVIKDACSEIINVDSKDNLIIAGERPVSCLDVEGLLIVDTPDALLIAKKGSSQKVKDVVARIKNISPELASVNRTAFRPWGEYTVLVESKDFKVKRIVVKPGQRLSLQKHIHRSEHWVVVSGTAIVQVGDTEKTITQNQSTFIPVGEKHRLTNPGKIDLVLIEVQVGEYVGEDDIIRIEDDFDRTR